EDGIRDLDVTGVQTCALPIFALGQAAAVTERLGLGTGITLVAQHDPIALAKQIATVDHLSGGRLTLGVGFGWNVEEAADHGVDRSDERCVEIYKLRERPINIS